MTHHDDRSIEESMAWVKANVPDMRIPSNFVRTVPVAPTGTSQQTPREQLNAVSPGEMAALQYPRVNPQTTAYCRMLGMKDVIAEGIEQARLGMHPGEEDPTVKRLRFDGPHSSRQ
jgi:hypothetical protein